MKVIFCGPPHSGKSVLIANLKRRLPDDSQRVFRACPDGENDLSNETGLFEGETRTKGEFSEEFINRFCRAIDNNKDSKIVLVDLGGKMSPENEEIMKHCDSFVVLASVAAKPEEGMIAWQRFANSIVKDGTENEHLECLALLDSELEATEEIYEGNEGQNKGEILKGKATGLARKTFIKESQLLDKLAAKIIKESGYELEDSKNLTLENLSGLALAESVGCLKLEKIEDVDVPKAFWNYEAISKVYEKISSLVEENQDSNVSVKINAIRPAFILCATTKALVDKGITNISTMDSELNEYVPIRRLEKKEGLRAADGIKYHVIESENAIFMDLDIEGQDYTIEEYANCVLPKIDANKPLYISGRIPNWLMASVVSSYDSSKISVLQPPKGFICTFSHDKEDIGKLEVNVPGINHVSFFNDKKVAKENKEELIFSNEDYVIDKNDKNDEEIGGRNGEESI